MSIDDDHEAWCLIFKTGDCTCENPPLTDDEMYGESSLNLYSSGESLPAKPEGSFPWFRRRDPDEMCDVAFVGGPLDGETMQMRYLDLRYAKVIDIAKQDGECVYVYESGNLLGQFEYRETKGSQTASRDSTVFKIRQRSYDFGSEDDDEDDGGNVLTPTAV
mgnify:CR=1 FL=1|tara:strand:- start:1110 stop:1595 length:486 start_codon:yes stop_codon:yes gene_type:complete